MERKEFLQLIGAGAAGTMLASCLASCKKQDTTPARLSRDFTLDLSSSANAALANPGGYLVTQQVIVAHTLSGQYIAVAAACTHQGTTIQFRSSSTDFRCPSHGATYASNGHVTGGPTNTDLQQFNTQLDGHILRIYS